MSRRLSLPSRRGPRKPHRRSRLFMLERMEERVLLAMLAVTTTANSGPGTTLQQALTMANGSPGSTIDFDVAGAATANFDEASGSITSLTLISAGGGYTTAPTVTIAPSTGTAAQFTANVSGGVITGFNLVSAGSGYTSAPAVTIAAGTAPFVISPTSALPAIANPTTIDGTSQPQYMGTPLIQIDGSSLTGSGSGLQVTANAANSTIEGLDITNFSDGDGILVSAAGVQVLGNYVGITTTGAAAGNGLYGVDLEASGDTVGGTTSGSGNVISGNDSNGGLNIAGSSNLIQGNYLGTDPTGTTAVANVFGVLLSSGTGNTIGGTTPGARNIISGNLIGVVVTTASSANLFEGNYIGTDVTGTVAVTNTNAGIEIEESSDNTIGGVNEGAGNLISGNGTTGDIYVQGNATTPATGNLIEGNLIGTNAAGTAVINPGGEGVEFQGASGNTLGGTTGQARNVISMGTSQFDIADVVIVGNGTAVPAQNNVVEGNYLGTDVTGTKALGSYAGLNLFSSDNTIGGTADGAGNVISGNANDGIFVEGAPGIPSTGNVIEGNFIGTDPTGTQAVGNGLFGIDNFDASGNTFGGTTPGARNVVSGNALGGVRIETDGSAPASNNVIMGNYIGTDATGSVALGNGSFDGGVTIEDASDTTVGGTADGAGNLISGNLGPGVKIYTDSLATPTDNVIESNLIGTDATGMTALGNAIGVEVTAGTGAVIGGTFSGTGNLISGNTGAGIELTTFNNTTPSGTLIEGNSIGTNQGGTSGVPNTGNGVFITGGASNNTVGGTATGAGNIIAFNTLAGVRVGTSATTTEVDDAILGNSIFANSALGIDLGPTGVTPNTPGGPHAGPNHLQNFPVITGVSLGSNGAMISGTLNSTPSATFTIQFFSSATGDPSGYGQGQTLLGQTSVTTDSSGNASFNTLVAPVQDGESIITATATDANGNTSEFSAFPLIVTNNQDSGTGSLRQAITEANAGPGGESIIFDISGGGMQTISLLSALPAITVPVTIDGTSQPGYFHTPIIAIDGTNAGTSADGLDLAAGAVGSTIEGLDIVNFAGTALSINANNTQVLGNYIGVDFTGLTALPNFAGILIQGAQNVTIGGTTAADRNVISGNSDDGIDINDPNLPTTDNVVEGNYIGTDATGATALGNQNNGISISGASDNTIGGTTPGADNVISGNANAGVSISDDGASAPAANNLVEGNAIGTDVSGTVALGNGAAGVDIGNASSNTVGGTTSAAGNLISGNAGDGVLITVDPPGASSNNLVEGNLIGTDVSGTMALGNQQDGVFIDNATGNTVGGTTSGAGNVISGNVGDGVGFDFGSTDNLVEGNFIGTEQNGTVALGNKGNGVTILDTSSNTVGGSASGAGNVISGNAGDGVLVTSDEPEMAVVMNNLIEGDFIGTDLSAAVNLGNSQNGVEITMGASANTVGGSSSADGNTIAYNTLAGVVVGISLEDAETRADAILSNSIFANSALGIDLGDDGVTMNTPGGPHDGPNLLQNYPVIDSAMTGATTTITGTFNSTPNSSFTLQFFSSASGDPSGFGQGQTYLGEMTVPTDGNGNAMFTATVAAPPAGQLVITATATDPNGNTSEFSQDFTATPGLVVTNTNDSGAGSLRQVIQLANAQDGPATITFDIDAPGVQTIQPLTPLPAITNRITIDGTSQPGYAGTPLIVINGSLAGSNASGLQIGASGLGSVVEGLAIDDFSFAGINVGANDTEIIGDYIGVNASGTTAAPNVIGVFIGTSGNTVGGTTAGTRNVISGNTTTGVAIATGTSNVVEGNYIGTDASGTVAIGNADGVTITDASGNTIGGTTTTALNVISGNTAEGIAINSDGLAPAANNVIEGNDIGTDVTGARAVANAQNGIDIFNASNNTVGGISTSARNIISGNTLDGVLVNSSTTPGSSGNVIEDNYIGTDLTGTKAVGNQGGVQIAASSGNTVGSTTAGMGNLISGNTADGVIISGVSGTASNNLVAGNFIGTDETGTVALGNQGDGVAIIDASGNTVGRMAAGISANVISGNTGNGVSIVVDMANLAATNNVVAGNFIGTDETGTSGLGNQQNGVMIEDASGNTIGETIIDGNGANVISANQGDGILVQSNGLAAAANNTISTNMIGTNSAGSGGLGNTDNGIAILDGSSNTVGGTGGGQGNLISANILDGVLIQSDSHGAATNNLLEQNLIGVDATGSVALPNHSNGVAIDDSSSNDVGLAVTRGGNTISGNLGDGVLVESTGPTGATDNAIVGNQIGTNSAGTSAIANGLNGIVIQDASTNTIGGLTIGATNLISGNTADGILIQSTGVAATTGNVVEGNYIGTNLDQNAAVANGAAGVAIVGASGNIIGGAIYNVISGNTGDGVAITGSLTLAATNNQVLTNLIGTNGLGSAAIANLNGVHILDASGNTIGGTTSGAGNTISGNTQAGILIESDGAAPASSNLVEGNLVGTDTPGTSALGNGGAGVEINGAISNTIGGTAAGSGNLISANTGVGVDIAGGGNDNTVEGNDIGTQLGGTGVLGNHDVGVVVTTTGNTIGGITTGARNIIVDSASNGVALDGTGNLVEGNFIGVLADGSTPQGNQGDGVFVGGADNTVGGTTAGAGNVISGNTVNGVEISGGATNTLVAGNLIGTDATGATAVANAGAGVAISGLGTSGNTIGGTAANTANLISGNTGAGVAISGQASGNVVVGNLIGTDITGTQPLGNTLSGVQITDASANTIGGTASAARNLISANIESGVLIESDSDGTAASNLIEGNDIGIARDGTTALGNEIAGVFIQSSSDNTIGSTVTGAGNLISGNMQGGIRIVGTTTLPAMDNLVVGNTIGTDVSGKVAVGNGRDQDGILIQDSSGNTIGKTTSGSGNLIAGNSGSGVAIVTAGGPAPSGNLIEGNGIGTDSMGTTSLANGTGVTIAAGSNNTIGGTTVAAQNVVSGNTGFGIVIQGLGQTPTANNLVEGNLIGTDPSGTVAVANQGGGVEILDSSGNTVGGTATGSLNLISGNTGAGVVVKSDGALPATGNVVAGNDIGTDTTGKLALGNSSDGVQLVGAAGNTVGGTSSSAGGNLISANGGNGVLVQNNVSISATNNTISANLIGTDITGTLAVDTNGKSLGNTNDGVKLSGVAGNTVGGTTAGSGNVISNNGSNGVELASNQTTDDDLVAGNLIGTDITGTKALGNKATGVTIDGSLGDTIGGTTAAARNVISGNVAEGLFITSVGSTTSPAFDLVIGNYVGTDVTGMKSLGNGLSGILLVDAVGVTIGLSTTGAGNLISGNGNGADPGIGLAGGTEDTLIEGNLIGTDATGLAPIGGSRAESNSQGIVLNQDAGNETIGGTATGAGNTIAFNVSMGIYILPATGSPAGDAIVGNTISDNGTDGITAQSSPGQTIGLLIQQNVITDNLQNGVSVENPGGISIQQNTISGNGNDGVKVSGGTGISILTNSIFNNTNLSIELVNGGNNGQASPVLTSATVSGGNTTILGTLQGTPNTLYHLQFFTSPDSPPPGFGDGETFFGEVVNVATDSTGSAKINVTLPGVVPATQYLTATATSQATNDTSQVSKTSPNLLVTVTAAPDPVNQGLGLKYTITIANDGASPTTGITLTDTLPTGVTFVGSVPAGSTSPGSNIIIFNPVDLNTGASMVYTISVRADTPGTVVNTATATYTNQADNPPINPANLTQTVSSTINPVANLSLTGTADQTSVVQGTNLTYTDTVENSGFSPAENVTLTDTLPAGVTFVSATGGVTPVGNVLTFKLGTLAGFQAMTSVTIVVQPTTPGTIVNTGMVTSTTTDLGPGPHSFSLSTTVTSVVPPIVVTNTNDSGPGSLRQAILDVNALTNPASFTIPVQITGPGPYIIQPATPLPAITHALVLSAPFVIDGSQIPTGPTPSDVGLTPGLLEVDAPGVVLEGLTLFGFNGFGIVLGTGSGMDDVIGDNIGLNTAGTAAPQGNTVGGVLVLSADNTIGGTSASNGNAIAGNAYGVYLEGAGATGNLVVGNMIGTDRSGKIIQPANDSTVDGIEIVGASNNQIGLPVTSPGTPPGNVIAGYQVGIYLYGGSSNNIIQGNAIRANGISTAANSGQELGGILLSTANSNQISDNVISSNTGSGLVLFNNAMGNVIVANNITQNTSDGVFVVGGAGNMIGIIGAGNTITGNGGAGVDLQGSTTTNNSVLANTIQSSGLDGVYIFNAPGNTIGGSTSGAGNTIENNGFNGVDLDGSGATGNFVQGNTIANQASGYGILLDNGATANTIGGTGTAGNALSNNALGNIQVLINGLPPSGNLNGGNTISGNTNGQTGQPLTVTKLKKHHHHVKAAKHVGKHHPHGPRHHMKKRHRA